MTEYHTDSIRIETREKAAEKLLQSKEVDREKYRHRPGHCQNCFRKLVEDINQGEGEEVEEE